MNKKINTLIFIAGATVVNMFIIAILLFLFILIISFVLPDDASPVTVQFLFLGAFLLSLVGSFFIYNRIVRFISKRIDMDKYFHPLFRRRKR